MWHTERTIYALAVLWFLSIRTATVASITKVDTAAPEESLAAAEHALPRDVLVAVLLAVELPRTNLLNAAGLAQELLLFGRFSELQIAFAVNQATEEVLFTLVTLVEGALVHEVLVKLTVVATVLLLHRL